MLVVSVRQFEDKGTFETAVIITGDRDGKKVGVALRFNKHFSTAEIDQVFGFGCQCGKSMDDTLAEGYCGYLGYTAGKVFRVIVDEGSGEDALFREVELFAENATANINTRAPARSIVRDEVYGVLDRLLARPSRFGSASEKVAV